VLAQIREFRRYAVMHAPVAEVPQTSNADRLGRIDHVNYTGHPWTAGKIGVLPTNLVESVEGVCQRHKQDPEHRSCRTGLQPPTVAEGRLRGTFRLSEGEAGQPVPRLDAMAEYPATPSASGAPLDVPDGFRIEPIVFAHHPHLMFRESQRGEPFYCFVEADARCSAYFIPLTSYQA
jgi:hypothetical protein